MKTKSIKQLMFAFIRIYLFAIFFFLASGILADDNYTAADVISSQTQNASAISDMSSSVEGVTEFNGMKQKLEYDYQMATDANGNNKIMVSTKGIFTMQFLVDTADMSVTFLMADGSQQKVTVSAGEQTQIQQMAGLSGSMGGNGGSLYAALGGKKGIVSDAAFAGQLGKTDIETDDMMINVRGKRGSGKKIFGLINNDDITDVEYINKKSRSARMKLDEALDKIRLSQPKTKDAENYKKKALKWFEENGNNALKSMVSRRVEHINMRTGLVEEQEIYNTNGEKMGHFKIRNKVRMKIRKRRESMKTSAAPVMAGGNATNSVNAPLPAADEQEIEVPNEFDAEMDSTNGPSKTHTKITNITINQDNKFEWIKPKKLSSR